MGNPTPGSFAVIARQIDWHSWSWRSTSRPLAYLEAWRRAFRGRCFAQGFERVVSLTPMGVCWWCSLDVRRVLWIQPFWEAKMEGHAELQVGDSDNRVMDSPTLGWPSEPMSTKRPVGPVAQFLRTGRSRPSLLGLPSALTHGCGSWLPGAPGRLSSLSPFVLFVFGQPRVPILACFATCCSSALDPLVFGRPTGLSFEVMSDTTLWKARRPTRTLYTQRATVEQFQYPDLP